MYIYNICYKMPILYILTLLYLFFQYFIFVWNIYFGNTRPKNFVKLLFHILDNLTTLLEIELFNTFSFPIFIIKLTSRSVNLIDIFNFLIIRGYYI